VREKISDAKKEGKDKYYQITATVSEKKDVIDQETLSAGRFVLATNVLSEKELSHEEMISKYKEQQSINFRFWILDFGLTPYLHVGT